MVRIAATTTEGRLRVTDTSLSLENGVTPPALRKASKTVGSLRPTLICSMRGLSVVGALKRLPVTLPWAVARLIEPA